MEGKERIHQCFKKIQLIWKYNLLYFSYTLNISTPMVAGFSSCFVYLRDAPQNTAQL